jgi:transposase InsO family protein
MSASTSPSTGQPYGVQRVCAAWDVPRSTFYHHRKRAAQPPPIPRRRGPRPTISDAALLEAIRADLKRSSFSGEGYRKVWARLRVLDGIRVARKRVLRLMREHDLLSPHRHPQGEPELHEGVITTSTPNVLWGTDGARVFTVDEGWVWIFSAVEHWNGECVGVHVCKKGDRFAALEPIAQGVTRLFGAVTADVARGLSLRMDHGSQYLADDFLNQIKHWGITPSFAFVAEPQTNGVAERFNRTLKEQVVHGRTYRTVDELRAAVSAFVQIYNTQWRLEKLDFLTPWEARQLHDSQAAETRAA